MWATPRSQRHPEILRRIEAHAPEVICLTETDIGLLPWEGHTVCPLGDYVDDAPASRRKVLLWSRQPWSDIDRTGDPDMPPGRYVRATTRTSAGDLTVMGVCIPWRASRTTPAAEPRRRRWEDHYAYLDRLGRLVADAQSDRLAVVGDYNQRIRPDPGRSRSWLAEGFPVSLEHCIGIAIHRAAAPVIAQQIHKPALRGFPGQEIHRRNAPVSRFPPEIRKNRGM